MASLLFPAALPPHSTLLRLGPPVTHPSLVRQSRHFFKPAPKKHAAHIANSSGHFVSSVSNSSSLHFLTSSLNWSSACLIHSSCSSPGFLQTPQRSGGLGIHLNSLPSIRIYAALGKNLWNNSWIALALPWIADRFRRRPRRILTKFTGLPANWYTFNSLLSIRVYTALASLGSHLPTRMQGSTRSGIRLVGQTVAGLRGSEGANSSRRVIVSGPTAPSASAPFLI
jgi:hypothetical protein